VQFYNRKLEKVESKLPQYDSIWLRKTVQLFFWVAYSTRNRLGKSGVVYDVMAKPKNEHTHTNPTPSISSIYRCHGNFVSEEFVRHLEESIQIDTQADRGSFYLLFQ